MTVSYVTRTGKVPLGVYECPKPYHRLLSPETLQWTAATGRFFFLKDTCCSIAGGPDWIHITGAGINSKLEALKAINSPHFKFFNANMATLLRSIQMGANGFCGIAANCYPDVIGTLWCFSINRLLQPGCWNTKMTNQTRPKCSKGSSRSQNWRWHTNTHSLPRSIWLHANYNFSTSNRWQEFPSWYAF